MSRREDLTGRQFGKWRVLRFDHDTKYRDAFWLCVCDCGTFKRVPRGRLQTAARTNGGCGHDMYARIADKNRIAAGTLEIFNGRYVAYRSRANRREFTFDLTLSQFAEIVQRDCFYCGAKPDMLPRSRPIVPGDPLVNGVDRIDSSLGYDASNVVPCCTVCNRMKLDLTLPDFLARIRRIAKLHG